MQLVINSYGAYLRKSGNCFLVKREDKSFEVAVSKVNSILITTSAYITTDAIKLAVDKDRQPGRFLLTGSANVLTL